MNNLSENGWFEKTPDDWVVERMKNIMFVGEKKSSLGKEELLSVTINEGVIKRSQYLNDIEGGSRAESLIGYKIVEKNNLVNNIMKMGFRCLGVSKYNGIVSPGYSVFILDTKKIYPKFLNFLLRIDRYIYEFRKLSKGIQESRMRLYDDYFLAIKVIIPPIDEQKIISEYLEKKISLIEKIIRSNEIKIKLLNEKKNSLIYECVFKGLDKKSKLKESGVEWIGKINSNWEIKRFSYCFSIKKGKIPKFLSEEKKSGALPYLSMEVLRGNEPLEFSNEEDLINVDQGDIGILWDGSNAGEIILINRKGILSSTMSVLHSIDNSLNKNFIYYLLKSYEQNIKFNTTGMGIPHVNGNYLKEIKIIIPPIKEQININKFLDIKVNKIEKITSMLKNKNLKLRSYCESLISSLTTGKIRINKEVV